MQVQSSKFKVQNFKKMPPPPPPFETLEPTTPSGGFRPSSTPLSEVEDQKKKLEEMKEADRKRSRQLAAKILNELEEEIKKWRRIREEQLKTRRQSPQEQQSQGKAEKSKESPPPLQEPSTKPKRGLFGLARRQGFWGRRIKSAQQQSQPEKVGRRIGG